MIEKPSDDLVHQFLKESNAIEGEYSPEALENAEMAWLYLERIERMTLFVVLNTHYFLMRRLRPDIAGSWRKGEVYIGGLRKDFKGLPVIESEVLEVLRTMNGAPATEGICKGVHVLFEEIHPFEDGNGRVGRMLYNWHRLRSGLPLHVIKEEYRQEYYKWFRDKGPSRVIPF